MAKKGIKIKDLARELGVTSRNVITKCRAEGIPAQNSITRLGLESERAVRAFFSEANPEHNAESANDESAHDDDPTPRVRLLMQVRRTWTKTPWEEQVGYCRAVRAGDHVYVTGCAPVAEGGGVHAPGDAYAQARRCLEIIDQALRDVGADRTHVVRTRMFVTDIDRWQEFGRAHREFFADHPPATSMVEVRRLIDPDMLIEIEADAICRR